MRCLHCGSTLSTFKKLTDADFCSAEHRDVFYGEQQGLILARLKQSAERYQRFHRPPAVLDLPRAAAATGPKLADAQAPAPQAAFRLSKPEVLATTLRLQCIAALSGEQRPAFVPLPWSLASSQRFSPLTPDFPWPRYNPGLQYIAEFLEADAVAFHRLPRLDDLAAPVRHAVPTPGLLPARRPDLANRTLPSLRTALRLARPKPPVSFGPVRIPVSAEPFGIRACRLTAWGLLEPSAPPLATPCLEVGPVAAVASSGIPASLRLAAGRPATGLTFLDRVYRMRPRSGVTSSTGGPVMLAVSPEPISSTMDAARPATLANATGALEPVQVSRFVRLRPRGPVTATTVSHLQSEPVPSLAGIGVPALQRFQTGVPSRPDFAVGQVQADVHPVAAQVAKLASFCTEPQLVSELQPAFPGSGSPSALEPALLQRLFRARPKPIASNTADIAAGNRIAESPASPAPSYPQNEPNFGPEPHPVQRFFRPRPRGPVAAELGQFAAMTPEVQAWTERPAIGTLPNPAFAFTVPAVSVLIGGRPGWGVLSDSNSDLTSAFRPETLASNPSTPTMELKPEPAPAPVTRLFRMRPRAGVDTATVAIRVSHLEPCAHHASEISNPTMRMPQLSPEVAFLDRVYRGRPRNAVESATPHFTGIPSGEPVPAITARPAQVDLPVAVAAYAPMLSERLFRARPKTGVLDAALASSLEAATDANPLLSAPATPALHLNPCEPVRVDRMFRMRPRNGVGHDSTSPFEVVQALAEAFPPKPAIGSFSPEAATGLAPRRMDRLFHGRPQAGVASASSFASGAATLALAFPSAPRAVTQALPDCEPAPLQRLFRFRPKVGVPAAGSSQANHAADIAFPAAKPEFRPDWWDVLQGAKPHFVNKMYRMRIKQPAQDLETVTRAIRTKHLPAAEGEPVLATLPAPASAAAPSFLDRLYRMRPRGGKTTLPAANAIPCEAIAPKLLSGAPASALQFVAKQWQAAPLRIKSIAATVPILLLLAAFPWGTPTRAAENPLRDAMSRRAAIERTANFGDGLSQWQGSERWTRTASGAIQPSGLALFQPSMNMKDYRLSFSTQVHKGGVGFVVRASDDRNYQAIKLQVVKAGPLPVVRVVRWAVIDGRETNRSEIPLPLTVTADTQYRIALEVNDRSFTLMVQDKVVDFWSEEQLKSGGAGFFGDKGERASIHSVRMTHQDDAIGKLFAALTL